MIISPTIEDGSTECFCAPQVQGFTVPMVEPDVLAYRRILWFSIPLGALGIGLLVRATPHPIVPEA
jgi:hypothetical protein